MSHRKFLMLAGVLATTAALAEAPAPDKAREKEADTCIRTKIWSGYDQGWAVRNATSARLGGGEHRVYVITLEAGLEYKLLACGDKGIGDLDLVLHDVNGKEVARDSSNDREPMVSFTSPTTESYYLAVYAARMNEGATTGGVATAVTYK